MSSQYLKRLNEEQRKALISKLMEIQSCKCFICQKEIDLKIHEIDIDHIVPLANHGKDSEENFAITHASCNRSKQDSNLNIARILHHLKNNKKLFEKLTNDRNENANILEKPSMQGVEKSVVEKYSDQAHFIYELLQNADDTEATEVHFELYSDKLIFKHNGTRHFSITDVDNEAEDSKNGRLGDLNSITSVGNSTKHENGNSIGKFGVGFKAVFQYTNTPHIYDKNFKFKIERLIVPVEIAEDYPNRTPDETIFVFPFDREKPSRDEACKDISSKLQNLVFPILFLNSLQKITFKDNVKNISGEYSKEILQKKVFDKNTEGQLLKLTQNDGEKTETTFLWTFSRRDEKSSLPYTVGFFVEKNDTENEKTAKNKNATSKENWHLVPKTFSAFCYFPTKVVTGLNFIIHAPFLLTDSREGIKASDEFNQNLIQELAELSADSLLHLKEISKDFEKNLIDENILNIIPYSPLGGDNRNELSFNPFYIKILNTFKQEEILPTGKNDFSTAKNAYLAEIEEMKDIFTNEQLQYLTENQEAKWIFCGTSLESIKRSFVENVLEIAKKLNANYYYWTLKDHTVVYFRNLLEKISEKFIENQTCEWLNKFYGFVLDSKNRCAQVKPKAVFLDENKKAVAAIDASEHQCLFLPSEKVAGYTTINSELFAQPNAEKLLKEYEITEPSLKDEIYNKIIPQYREEKKDIPITQLIEHFEKIFAFYLDCSQNEKNAFISELKELKFILCKKDDSMFRASADELYFPDDELKKYFSANPETKFLDWETYKECAGKNEKEVKTFFEELGVARLPRITKNSLMIKEFYNIPEYKDIELSRYSSYRELFEMRIDGDCEILTAICTKKDFELSALLWKVLLLIIQKYVVSWKTLENQLQGEFHYFYRKKDYQRFHSHNIIWLREKPWLLNSQNEFASPNEITVDELSSRYDTSSEDAKRLIEFLQFKEPVSKEIIENLSDSEKQKFELGSLVNSLGLTKEDLLQFAEQKKRNIKTEQKAAAETSQNLIQNPQASTNNSNRQAQNTPHSSSTKSSTAAKISESIFDYADETENLDEDAYTKPPVDYSKKLSRAKQKHEAEENELEKIAKYQNMAETSEKYSYAWFKALLELECFESAKNNSGSREISISFGEVEREEGTERTLVLKQPSRYIPQFMEDLENVSLQLIFKDGAKNQHLEIEVSNVANNVLKVRLKPNEKEKIGGINFSEVIEARIDPKSPVFLLEELKNSFAELKLEDNFNMKSNLPENIEFIFGPPGTGKTTHLANNVILPLIAQNENLKILVLAPTNKAADVIVEKIMQESEDDSYKNWLVRFGITASEKVEKSGVFKDKAFDIETQTQSVVVTTIARFPYDFFILDSQEHFYLKNDEWDYIIVDEASMVSLVNVIYPLYKSDPKKFIIAGDPHQIAPITSVDKWKDENIYTLVELNSFANPTTEPHNFPVKTLTTQWRSISEIGEVFSALTYDGILQHNRKTSEQKKLLAFEKLNLKSLNIVNFPVHKYESIFKAKKLNNSPYQIYAALFTFEYLKFLSKKLSDFDSGKKVSIGVVAPYRAEADLIERLCSRFSFGENLSVQCDTIHGFQGDECDVIIAVFNPPPTVSNSRELFLNKKNIINVAISRARDYLILLMPEVEGFEKLTVLPKLKQLCKGQNHFETQAKEIERIIFDGNENFIEENSFSTSHQNVNVYGKAENRYEIRTEESAVDIQVHPNIKNGGEEERGIKLPNLRKP